MDTYAFGSICDTAAMAKVMGTRTVLSGIKAGVASVLVEFDVDIKRVALALNLEAGLAMLAGRDGHDTPEAELHDHLADPQAEDGAGEDAPGGGFGPWTVPLRNGAAELLPDPAHRS
jgi:rsbT antagonist protein RsbS